MSYQTQPGAPSYDVFVSYSRMDGPFVERLVKRLESFAPPKGLGLPTRRLSVFVDTEDLYGSEYYESIERALRSATRLIVVCSPHARASVYVSDEIKRFLANPDRTAADVVPVLYAGVPNNEAHGPEDEARKAFPDLLYEIMKMPLAVDFRGFDSKRHQIGGGAYRNPWFTLLATLLDINRDELEEREYRRVRRRRLTIGAIAAAVIFSLSVLSAVALWQRNEAIDQRRHAYAQRLAAQAQLGLADTVAPAEQAVLRALASLQLERTDAAMDALKTGLTRLRPRLVTRLALGPEDDLPHAPRFSPNGKRLLGSSKAALMLWDTNDGKRLLRHTVDGTPAIHGITADNRHAVASVLRDGESHAPADLLLIDTETLKVRKTSVDRLFDVIVAKDGPLALTADREGRHVRTYDPVREKPVAELEIGHPVIMGGLHRLQDRVALVDSGGRVSVRDRRLDKVIASFKLPAGAKPIAFGLQAGVLPVSAADGDLEVYDLERGTVISRLSKSKFLGFTAGDRFMLIDGPDGRHLVSVRGERLLNLEDRRATDWDLRAMGDLARQMPIVDVGASEDGTVLVTARKDGRISVWQPTLEPKYGAWGAMPMPSFRNIAHFDHGDDFGLPVVWAGPPTLFVSQSGRHIASQSMGLKANAVGGIASYRPMVRIWHLRGGSEIARFYPRGGMQLAFAPAGDLLVTLSPLEEGETAKGQLALWRLSPVRARVERTRREAPSGLIETGASPAAFFTVAISPDGRRAVWLAADGQLRVWNAETRRTDTIDDLRPVSRTVFEKIKREPTPSNPLLQSGDAEPGTPTDPLAQLIEKQGAKNRPDAAISLFPLVVSGDGCCALIAVGPLLRVYRLDTGRLIAERTLADVAGGLALSHDGQVFAATTTNWQNYQLAALEFKNSKKHGDLTPIIPSYVQVIHVFSVDKAKSLGAVTVTQSMTPPSPVGPVILPMAVTVDSHGRWLGVRRIIQDREAPLSLSFKIQFAVVSITDGATLFETPVKKWSWNPMDFGSMGDLNMSSAAFSADGRRLVIEAPSTACITKLEITASLLPVTVRDCDESKSILEIWDIVTGQRSARTEIADMADSTAVPAPGMPVPVLGRRLALIDDVTVLRGDLRTEITQTENKKATLITERITVTDVPLITEACARLPIDNRTLSQKQWKRELPGESYRPTCDTKTAVH